MIYHQQADSMI